MTSRRDYLSLGGSPSEATALGLVDEPDDPETRGHAAHIERTSTGSYYAWCSTCDWRSVTRRVEPIIYEAAKRHERDA